MVLKQSLIGLMYARPSISSPTDDIPSMALPMLVDRG